MAGRRRPWRWVGPTSIYSASSPSVVAIPKLMGSRSSSLVAAFSHCAPASQRSILAMAVASICIAETMTAHACCGPSVDDDEELDRLLAGLELPDVEGDAPHDGLGPQLTDLDEIRGDWE